MVQGGLQRSSKKYLSWIAISLFALLVLLSPKAFAAEASGGRACDNGGVHPSPYTNGAPISKVFYPADGSTVTVTSTGAVIKQSPCQTPYREGWISTADLCNLTSFSQLSGKVVAGPTNPYTIANPNATCAPVVTPAPAPAPAATPARPADVTVVQSQTINNPPAPVSPTPAPSSPPVVQSASTTTPSPAAALPDTGPNDVLAVGSISTVLGTVGHFFYRRRGINN